MTEKELKKLNRYQLLELLLVQSAKIDELQAQLDEAQHKIDAHEIQMTVVGSIAEASVKIGGVFEAAQKTADIYLETLQGHIALAEENAKRDADKIIKEARKKAEQIVEEAKKKTLPR